MGCKNFKQGDKRWGSFIYAGEPMSVSGCGPTACADIIGVFPNQTASWLANKGYSVNGHGTEWNGIGKCLNAYGYNGRQLNTSSLYGIVDGNVENVWKAAMLTGKCYAILLMGPGTFTSGGHYICVTEYDGIGAYVYDPACESRDGWHSWRDFSGQIKVFYLMDKNKRVENNEGTNSEGGVYMFKVKQIQIGDEGNEVLLLEEILMARKYYSGGLDKSYGPLLDNAVRQYQKDRNGACGEVDGIVGPKTWNDLIAL